MMVKIDEEIKSLDGALDTLEDIHPDYMPPELKHLQTRVLAHHAQFETAMEARILEEVRKLVPPVAKSRKAVQGARILLVLQPLLNSLSYKQKVDILEGYEDAPPELIPALKKVNAYRIEFAHPDGMKLRGKYNPSTAKGKVEIRNLLRALVKAHQELNKYFKEIR